MKIVQTQRGQLLIGTPEEVEQHSLQEWRERTIQERLDIFVELMQTWHPNAPGLTRTARIVEVPRG